MADLHWWQWLLGWFALSLPVGVLIGKWFKANEEAWERLGPKRAEFQARGELEDDVHA